MPEEPYQVMPEHEPESYEALKSDIRNRGFKDPITVDERGKILDGHTRIKIYVELLEEGEEIAYPPKRVVKSLFDDVEKRTLARKENALRRQLTSKQRKKIGQDQIKDTPKWTNTRIAGVVGVTATTVGNWRIELEEKSEIDYIDQLENEDGSLATSRETMKGLSEAAHSKGLMGAAKRYHAEKVARTQGTDVAPSMSPAGATSATNSGSNPTVGEAINNGTIPANEPLPPPRLSDAQVAFYDLKKFCNLFLPVDAEEVAAECTDPNDAQARMEDANRAIEWFTDFSEALAATARREMTALSGGKER